MKCWLVGSCTHLSIVFCYESLSFSFDNMSPPPHPLTLRSFGQSDGGIGRYGDVMDLFGSDVDAFRVQ
jgi:hypothetical protein